MTIAQFRHLLSLGLTAQEIWCAIAEPVPWTRQYEQPKPNSTPASLPAAGREPAP